MTPVSTLAVTVNMRHDSDMCQYLGSDSELVPPVSVAAVTVKGKQHIGPAEGHTARPAGGANFFIVAHLEKK